MLKETQAKIRIALVKVIKSNNEGHWNSYKTLQREFKTPIRKSKGESWHKFCEDINELPEVTKLKKILTKTNEGKVSSLKYQTGNYTKNEEETLEVLLQCHFPENIVFEDTTTAQNPNQHITSTRDRIIASKVVTEERLRWAISFFSSYKSPGTDNIYAILVKHGLEIIEETLRKILRASITLAYMDKKRSFWQCFIGQHLLSCEKYRSKWVYSIMDQYHIK